MAAHLFAVYVDALLPDQVPATVQLKDPLMCHRLLQVLRLQPGDALILFTSRQVYQAELSSAQPRKGGVSLDLLSVTAAHALQPAIDLYVGLAKKDALEEVAYAAAQMGVRRLFPVRTSRVQRSWGRDKERERLEAIMVAACEQSKQFVLPELHDPIEMERLIIDCQQQSAQVWIYCSPVGQPLHRVLQSKRYPEATPLALIIGPEGGLSRMEEEALPPSVCACALAPTVLRTRDVGLLACGMVRALTSGPSFSLPSNEAHGSL